MTVSDEEQKLLNVFDSPQSSLLNSLNVGLFVPLHFCSRERKVLRWNFCSMEFLFRGTFAP